MKPTTTLLFGGALLLSAGAAYTQTAGRPALKPQHPDKVILTECQDGDNCGTWTVLWPNGTGVGKGYAKWRTGEEAVLDIEFLDTGKVTVHRTDVQGTKEGLTAAYDGTLSDDKLGGSFTSMYKGKKELGYWNATVSTAQTPPPSMNLCIAHCFPIHWEDGHYVNYGPQNTSIYTVESFTRESFVMHRTDRGSFPLTATLTGKLSSDGNHVVDGEILWTSGNTGRGTFRAGWDGTVPGSDPSPSGPRGVVVDPAAQRIFEGVTINVLSELFKDGIRSAILNQ